MFLSIKAASLIKADTFGAAPPWVLPSLSSVRLISLSFQTLLHGRSIMSNTLHGTE